MQRQWRQKLQANDEEKGETGWKDCEPEFLLNKFDEEVQELKDIVQGFETFRKAIKIARRYDECLTHGNMLAMEEIKKGLRKVIGKEAADVGNICMMISDIYGALECVKRSPEIVCLCGSTRFYKTFDEQNFKLTLEGKIVLSIGCNTKSDEGLKLTPEDKMRLDELHKRKIDLCDWVLVLNVDGYIGDSTKSEIAYAKRIGNQ